MAVFQKQNSSDPASIATAIVSTLIVGYGIWDYWGPYKWIAELQLKIFGAYEVKITLMLAFCLCLIVLLPIQFFLQRMQSDIGSEKKPSTFGKKLERFVSTRSGQAILAGVGMLLVGAYNLGVAYSLGELTPVDLAALDSHAATAPTSRWWKVRGRLLFSETQVWESNHSKSYYVPLVSSNWKPGEPVSVVLREQGLGYERLSKGPSEFVGIADLNGVPGQVRDHWQSQSATIGAQTVLVENGDGPNKRESMGTFFSFFGLALVALGIGTYLYSSRKQNNS